MKFVIVMSFMFCMGCSSVRIESIAEPVTNFREEKAYHFLFGFIPAKKFQSTEGICSEGAWASTTYEYSFLDAAITTLSAGLVIPQTVRTECR
jgi:hypothetical protein